LIYNIEADPREEFNINTSRGWVAGHAMRIIGEYLQTLKNHPNPPAPNLANYYLNINIDFNFRTSTTTNSVHDAVRIKDQGLTIEVHIPSASPPYQEKLKISGISLTGPVVLSPTKTNYLAA